MPTQKEIFQAIWRKAFRTGKVELTLKSTAEAHKVRFALYNSLKGVKRGQEFDNELEKASRECLLQIRGNTITLTRTDSTELFATLLEAAGDCLEGESKTQVEVDAAASERRMAELFSAGAEKPKNPFYTREN